MFNHECSQRGGEVVGACMDGFLFGACCQLKSDSQSHIPKGPGVVMTSYLDYPDAEPESDDYESEQLNAWHNSFKPIVTPGYKPGEKTQGTVRTTEKNIDTTTEGIEDDFNEGLTQITNTLLQQPPKDSMYIKPANAQNVYSHSSINHGPADTILLHQNGSEVDDIARPSDFNVHISSMQMKPTVPPTVVTSTTPKAVSTHHPYTKPIFRPKPSSSKPEDKTTSKQPEKKTTTTTTTERYIPVKTVTKETQITELSSINSIIQMLNESTPSLSKDDVTTPSVLAVAETKSSPTPTATVSPVSYSSGYPNYYISTGHYVTLKPSSQSTVAFASSTTGFSTTKRPSTTPKYTTPNSITFDNKYSSTSKPYYTSPKPSQTTSQAIDAFSNYPTNPNDFGDSLTTFSYVSSTTTRTPPTVTTRKPPSTSYVYGNNPLKRPATDATSNQPIYDIAPDNFPSVTPTVIVLNGFQTAKPQLTSVSDKETEFVEISQEPFKKPVNTITVNNHIESTNNIYMGRPPSSQSSSPTVVITPKPSPTTPYTQNKPTTQYVSSYSTTPQYDSYTEFYSQTTIRPELHTSPDDLINFPPVRNPLLNATGSNPGLYNTSITVDDNEVLHDLEFTTPTWQEDEKLNEKMNLFVNKIVGSLQGTFQELHDIVILDKKPNATIIKDTPTKTTTSKPVKKTPATTRRPQLTTRKPVRATTTSKKPQKTTKKPVKLTTAARRPTTTNPPPTTTTKKSVS